ncbi:hypothetical protein ACWGKW_28935 [Streptomyces sp. NPDC054766]
MTANGCVRATADPPVPGGFARYLASTHEHQDAILPTSGFAGTPEDAPDCACGLYLTDPSI